MAERKVYAFLILGLIMGALVACAETKQETFHTILYSIPNEWEKSIENEDGNYYTVSDNKQEYFSVDYTSDLLESKFDEDAKVEHFDTVKNKLINEEKEGVISNLRTERMEGDLPYYLIQYDYIYSKKEGTIYVWVASMIVEEDLYNFSYTSKDNKDYAKFLKIINSVELQ